MWNGLEKGFQTAFEMAWEAYRAGTVPIGAAIFNESGEFVAAGRNEIFAGNGPLARTNLAHAEVNAILSMGGRDDHLGVRGYTLYTTTEPCPMCFGAALMANFRRVMFAARDAWAGASSVNETFPYAKSKNIVIEGPFGEPEIVQTALSICGDLYAGTTPKLLDVWEKDCPRGMEAGKRLYESGVLKEMSESNAGIQEVYDYILNY